jgi:glycosyltransferase involved in cell wall biosynthesis
MNIVQIMSGNYPPEEGIGSHVCSMSRELEKKGHNVKIIIRNYNVSRITEIKEQGIEVVMIPVLKIPFISTFLFKKKVEKYFKNNMVDVVHLHSPLVPFVKVNCRKIVTTFHSTMKVDSSYIESINLHSILNKIMGKFLSPIIEKRILKKSDAIIVVSQDVEDELRISYKYKKNNIFYIPNGINKDTFYRTECEIKKQIVYLGRLGYRKGLPVLIESIKDLKDYLLIQGYEIILSGEGPLKGYLNNYIENNNLSSVVTITFTKQNKVNQLLNESKFLIMNSTYETGPRTVLESLFTNTPVIATKVGLLKYFNDKDYINISDFDKNSTISAIKEAIGMGDSHKYIELQERCSSYINEFDNTKITNKMINIYKQ